MTISDQNSTLSIPKLDRFHLTLRAAHVPLILMKSLMLIVSLPMLLWWSAVGQSHTALSLQEEFPSSGRCGNKVYSQCFGSLPSPQPSVILCRKTASNRDCLSFLSATRSEQQARLGLHSPFSPSFIRSLPFPLDAKDTAKATAIVFKLFILSQDCVVIYNVNTENTL